MNKDTKGYLERIAEVVEFNAGIISPTDGQKNEEGYLERIAVGAELGGIGGGGGGGTPARYQAGDNIQITGLTISAPNVATKTELNTVKTDLHNEIITIDNKSTDKQDKLTADVGIRIINNVISAVRNENNTYTKAEVDELIQALDTLQMEVVAVRPTTGQQKTIYLVGNDTDGYVQWVYLTSGWVSLGSTEVNLSAYATAAEIESQYQKKLTAGSGITITSDTISAERNASNTYTKTEIATFLNNKQDTLSAGDGITISSGNVIAALRTPTNTYTKTEVDGLLNTKQNTLTAGTGITISGNTISGRDSYTKTETDTLLNTKQATLTAGEGIDITNNIISATGGGGSGSGDITFTTGKLTYNASYWKSYPPASGGTIPVPTKISFGTTASIVQLAGDFSPKNNLSSGYDGIVASLPEGFEPNGYIRVKGHYGNSDYSWLLTVTPDGDVRFSNFPMSVPQDAKFSFAAMWIRQGA